MTWLRVARPRYKDTVQKLIEATDKKILRQEGVASYIEAVRLAHVAYDAGELSHVALLRAVVRLWGF
jgi:hypothetical protein